MNILIILKLKIFWLTKNNLIKIIIKKILKIEIIDL